MTGASTMATHTITIPGLSGGPLTTSFPIFINLVPKSLTRNRPGIKARADRRSIQHGTGNPSSTAKGESNYLKGGAEGRQASFHFATDDECAYVNIPVDEVTWQAADGSGPGNMNGISNELAENTKKLAANPDRMIEIAAELMGKVSARESVVKGPQQHWDYNFGQAGSPNRHNCPNWLRSSPARWNKYKERWTFHFNAEKARMAGGEAPTSPDVPTVTYAPPLPIPELEAITKDLKRWQSAPAQITGPDGTRFILVADVVEAKKATARKQRANVDSADVGPPLSKGERFIALWLFVADDGKLWYLTEYWTRILEDDCTRIADAPILEQEAA